MPTLGVTRRKECGAQYSLAMFVAEVSAIIREVASAEVVTRFRSLAAGDVIEKSPGDVVTTADRECERVLAARLRQVRDIAVVGEEGAAADPGLLELVDAAPAAWVVDPIDGTSNFVAGSTDFVVMVALVENGITTAAWVWHPETDRMLTAELGGGVKSNGELLARPERKAEPTGVLKRKYMDEPARSRLANFPPEIGRVVPASGSAGIEYASLIDGTIDFLLYWRTLPWDHAMGALFAAEAGLRVGRLDGTAYQPGDGRVGLLSATPELWPLVAAQVNAAPAR